MLFDLRSRGRRNTVKVIYLFLALLMGGGLVFFGIGGATSGGLLDAFKNENKTSSSNPFSKEIAATVKQTQLHPADAATWAKLAKLRYQDAGTGDGYDQNSNSFTDKGRARLAGVQSAWSRYLALNPKHPDPDTAVLMVQAFGPTGLNKPDQAVAAMELVSQSRKPSASIYAQLAQLAYAAGQTRKGDLASAKAVALAPKDQKDSLKAALQSAKTQGAASTSATATTG